MPEDDSIVLKPRELFGDVILTQNADELAKFMDQPLTAIAETITGALAAGPKAVACTQSHSAHSQPEQPDLKETIEWINQTYNPSSEPSSKHCVFVLRNKSYVDIQRSRTVLRLDGCAATIEAKQDPNLEMSSESVTSTTWSFNLGDIDPAIEVENNASDNFPEPCDTEPKSANVCDEAAVVGAHQKPRFFDHAPVGWGVIG